MALNRRTLLLACSASFAAPAAFAQGGAVKLFTDSHLIQSDRFSIEVIGAGPDVVLIPGLASSRETWRATAEQLRGRCRLHLVQVAGFAGEPSRLNSTGPLVTSTADAIGAYVIAAGLSPATLIGHSLGGTIALRLAQGQPDTLSKVMLVDSLPFYAADVGMPAAAIEQMRAQLRAGQIRPQPPAQLAAQLRSMSLRPQVQDMILGWSSASDAQVVANAYIENFTLDQKAGLRELRVPLTLVRPADPMPGQTQEAFDAVYARAFEGTPMFREIKIAEAAHFVMLDQPEAFGRAIDAFLP